MSAQGKQLLSAAFVVVAFFLPGCKTTSTADSNAFDSAIDMRMMLPAGAQVMEVPLDKTFLMASPVTQPMPAFPSNASQGTDVSVCVEIVVSEAGDTRNVVPIYGLPECPLAQPEIDPRFAQAVTDAVEQWQFLAAAICTFPTGTQKTEDCSGSDVEISPVAIKLSYVFWFKRSGRVTATPKRA